ncbi:hypothetical protein PROFUN_06518 [Planoprotostelium fungivorum]|uniref:N-alpha-acetyltransferase 60 n=1 Tax=Planoprotostelium fungivorum TaxID=1890364 RepID=A0A2P6NP06_9EUKA|nr:hypothetical protein PROFUN_06518 [Planoprotostelium fungivorum]
MLDCPPLLSGHSEENTLHSHNKRKGSKEAVRFQNGLCLEWKTLGQVPESEITAMHEACLPVSALRDGSTSMLALTEKRTGKLVGIITSQTKSASQNEDCSGVATISTWGEECALTYILTLCVSQEHRKIGVASTLLRKLIEMCVRGEPGYTIKRHDCPRHTVLSSCLNYDRSAVSQILEFNTTADRDRNVIVRNSNVPAIYFYENHKFEKMKFYRNYYLIDSKSLHAFVYALFINGGRPPTHFIHKLSLIWSSYALELTEYLIQAAFRLIRSVFTARSNEDEERLL